jgi:hypothetical protein
MSAYPIVYSRGERIAMITLGLIGGVLLNSVFVYWSVFHWEVVTQAMTNPVALAFIVESFLLLAFLTYFLRKWGVARLGWGWFLALSLLGTMAFALPVVLLWPRKKQEQPPSA